MFHSPYVCSYGVHVSEQSKYFNKYKNHFLISLFHVCMAKNILLLVVNVAFLLLHACLFILLVAPNNYSLPPMICKTVQSGKRQAPCYSLSGRSMVGGFHEDLAKVHTDMALCQLKNSQLYFLSNPQLKC